MRSPAREGGTEDSMTMGQLHDQPPGHGQARGIHGMLVFGGQHTDSQFRSPVYVSHLPMFMHPHEFQVIARVSGTAAGIYGDFAAHFGTSTIYTFKPEPFSIDELDPSGGGPARTSIAGTLFRGHFERGGEPIGTGVSVDIEQIVHFRRFSPEAGNARDHLRYICFGGRDLAFLAHVITAPPDFDQILAVQVGALNGVSDDNLRAGLIVRVPDRSDDVTTRLQEAETITAEVQDQGAGTGGSVGLTAEREIYLETGDLAAAM